MNPLISKALKFSVTTLPERFLYVIVKLKSAETVFQSKNFLPTFAAFNAWILTLTSSLYLDSNEVLLVDNTTTSLAKVYDTVTFLPASIVSATLVALLELNV